VAFLERGQLLLVAVSAMGEPPAALRRQLILVHGQARCLLHSKLVLPSATAQHSCSRLLGNNISPSDMQVCESAITLLT